MVRKIKKMTTLSFCQRVSLLVNNNNIRFIVTGEMAIKATEMITKQLEGFIQKTNETDDLLIAATQTYPN